MDTYEYALSVVISFIVYRKGDVCSIDHLILVLLSVVLPISYSKEIL